MTDEIAKQTEETQSNLTSNVGWFVAGALIGAAVAVLIAPKSGKETRQFLAGKVHEGKDAVADTGASIVEASRDMFDRGKRLVEDAADLFERGRKLVKG
jgi:gas vesicle protein